MDLRVAAAKAAIGLKKLFDKNSIPFCSAIITAAGSGTRMGGVSKQFIELNGKKTVLYSLEAFGNCDYVKEIVVTARADEVEKMKETVGEFYASKPVKVVAGGKTRQESVENAFFALDKKCGCVAIHDAARPLVTSSDAKLLFEEAFRYGAATAAYPVADSMKKVDGNLFLASDADRDGVWAVQTPQVFLCDVYKAALAVARRDSLEVTDDNSIVTHAGFSVKAVNTGNKSFKLTSPEDVGLIEALLVKRKEENIDNSTITEETI
ncbi:MAG: 2-C-methyl-D-erythritol 4-phosphate cytidylyltransferase [Clostridia bacterium]|nr:2-C-methyl-D-erythritol 4-phosphate cytidylyltransferase [Clostridia bacterium]